MDNSKLTVVMLNWKRPKNVEWFADQYADMQCVSQVIIWDASPLECAPLDFIHNGKVTIITSTDFGLPMRFAAGALARTEAVMLVDDDIDIPESTVTKMFSTWRLGKHPLVGIYGRIVPTDGKYKLSRYSGPVPIVLTRGVIARRDLMGAALTNSMLMAEELGGEPFGNGEDIVLSYTAMARFNVLNLAMKLPWTNVGDTDPCAICERYADHTNHRTRVITWCRNHILHGKLEPR